MISTYFYLTKTSHSNQLKYFSIFEYAEDGLTGCMHVNLHGGYGSLNCTCPYDNYNQDDLVTPSTSYKWFLWCEFQICAHIDFPSSETKVDEFEMWLKCGKSRHAFQGPLEYGSKSCFACR